MEPTTKQHINDRATLERRAKEIVTVFKSQFPPDYTIDFLERNTVITKLETDDSAKDATPQTNISPEVLIEVKIYNTALENTKKALGWCTKNDIRVHRPVDFYAEMFKSDAHMDKIKNKLEAKKNSVIKQERERLNKKQKKFQKQLRHNKNIDAAKEKKRNLDAIDKWKSEIKQKKDKAQDLDVFISESNNQKGQRGGSRDGQRGGMRGGHRGGSRDGQRGGHRGGSRDGQRGSYRDGSRDGQRGGNRGDSRDVQRGGSRDGPRDSQRGGMRGGFRDVQRRGSRDGQRGGSRDGQRGGMRGGSTNYQRGENRGGSRGSPRGGHRGGSDRFNSKDSRGNGRVNKKITKSRTGKVDRSKGKSNRRG